MQGNRELASIYRHKIGLYANFYFGHARLQSESWRSHSQHSTHSAEARESSKVSAMSNRLSRMSEETISDGLKYL
jgi:hypothetical protein